MLRRFLSELKRRRVIRVAGVYAVTCWALFQVVNSLFPVLRLPPWTVTLVAVLLMLGFPIALIIAWAFESAEGGVRLTPQPDKDAPVARLAWSDWAMMAAAAAIIGVSAFQMSGGLGRLPLQGAASAAAAKSVAVLPFANFSSQKDSELFADGMTEEVINSLAQIPDLKVAGRTSAFYFKGRDDDLRLIGRKLGVSHVLEGSVRQEGERLRVTVQLIKVEDGFHIWSGTYDRKMDDAFAIQTEIADKVADVLKTKLDMQSAPRGGRLTPEAYNAALVARTEMRRIGLEPLTSARTTFKRLIDSKQADASVYAGYAQSTILLAQNYLTIDFNEADAESHAAIETALQLDPNSAEAYVAKGYRCVVRTIRVSDQACADEAAAAYARAAQLKPRDPDVLVGYANFLMKRPNDGQALALLQRALAIDPLNRVALMLLADAQSQAGHIADAERGYRSVIELYPDFVDAKQNLAGTLIQEGKLDQAEPWLRSAAAAGTDPSAAIELAFLYINLGMTSDFNATVAQMKAPPVLAALAEALKRVSVEDYAGALTYCETRFAADRDPVWLGGIVEFAIMTHDFEKARRYLLLSQPELFEPDPKVDAALAREAIGAAYVSDQLGDHAQARRIITKVLQVTAPKPGAPLPPSLRVLRSEAYAVIGDKEASLAELRQAIAAGYRTPWDIDVFVRLDRYPQMAAVKDDPRYQAMIRQIDADNARMRAAVLAARS